MARLRKMKIVDEQNGSYKVCCSPKREGENKTIVQVNGNEITELPTIDTIHVRRSDPTNVCELLVEKGLVLGISRCMGGGGGGVAISHNNEIIVCDNGNDRLQVFSEKGAFIKTIKHELLTDPTGICTQDPW